MSASTTQPIIHGWQLLENVAPVPQDCGGRIDRPSGHPHSFPPMKRNPVSPASWNHAPATFESSNKIDIKSKSGTSDPFVFRLYGDPILTLRANGIVEIAKDYTPSEAGAAFLAYVREHWPKEESCRRILELEERIKRLEDAGDKVCGQIGCGCTTAIDRLCEYCKQASNEWHQFTETKP